MRIITFLLLVFLPLISCKKEKPSYASVKKSLLNDVESYTGFEESRYLVAGFIELLEDSIEIDLKDKKAVSSWWNDYYDSQRCLTMLFMYKSNDKTYGYSVHDALIAKIRKTILRDKFMNYSYLMSNINSFSEPTSLGDDREIYDNFCEIPENRFDNFRIKYILNRNHSSFKKFNKFKSGQYKKQYKELYDRVEKIRKVKKSN